MHYNKFPRFLNTSIFIIFLILSSSFGFYSVKKSGNTLFKLGDKEFSGEEFEYYFSKNNDELTKDSVDFKVREYLDLFLKFRLKVLEAETRNMHQEEAFIQELGGYQKQLVKPYLTESKLSESLIQEAYNRMKEEVRASHILLKVDEKALPEDTLKVYNRLLNLKSQLEAGANFDSLALEMSEDPSAKQNKGDLGYFSAFSMVYPFEQAAFNTKVGSISKVIRTKFGYHLLKVMDRRKAQGKVKVAHIMLRVKQSSNEEDRNGFESKVKSIHEKLTQGEDWNQLCELYSEDNNTKSKGGVLNWFGTGNLVKEFEVAAFGLQNKGDISAPFETRFGWHIVKLIEKKPIEPLEEIRSELERKISRDGRSKVKKIQTLRTLKDQNNYQINLPNKEASLNAFDSTLLMGTWQMDSTSFANHKLFELKTTPYTSWDFAAFVNKRQNKRKGISIEKYIESLYNQFEEKSIFEFEEKNIERSNKEYRMILSEYRDGILLFNLMEKEIWGKAVKDTVGQEQFYNTNLSNYAVKESAKVRIFVSDKTEIIERAKSFVNSTKKEIDRAFNSEEPLNLQVFDKTIEKGEDSEIDKFWTAGIHNFERDNRQYLLQVQEIIPAGHKPMTSIKGQVISDYQNYLEEEWLESLKLKYPVKINKSTLKQVIKKIENQLQS